MKKTLLYRILLATGLLAGGTSLAEAQYYEIANQIPQLIRPALTGGFNYKGFVEAGYSKTVGRYDADMFEISTSQGMRYNNWFYMGVGIGVDFLNAHTDTEWGSDWRPRDGFDLTHPSTKTAVMMPLFTDFRFNFGSGTAASFYADLKVGCSFLLSRDYIEIGDGYLTNQQYFYLRPSLGVRIPVNSKNPKQAIDVGITYKLLTSNYWNNWSRNVTLNSFGGSIAYEW